MGSVLIRPPEPAFRPPPSLALLLSASANPEKGEPEVVQIAEVEEASRLGADAVVLFTALAGQSEPGMIRTLAAAGRGCGTAGIPLMAAGGRSARPHPAPP